MLAEALTPHQEAGRIAGFMIGMAESAEDAGGGDLDAALAELDAGFVRLDRDDPPCGSKTAPG